MSDPLFRAQVRPTLSPEAAALTEIYDATYGSCSPGCCPEALANVLSHIAESDPSTRDLHRLAAALRGEPSAL